MPGSEPECVPSSEKPFLPLLGTFRRGSVDINTYMNTQQPNSDPEDVRNVGNTAHIHDAKAQGQHSTRLARHMAVRRLETGGQCVWLKS
jgi:hypothetical protein